MNPVDENNGAELVERDPKGRFLQGVSGNPGGRPRRLEELVAVLNEQRTPANLRKVLDRLFELATRGEPWAIKLYLDRMLGPVRSFWEDEEIDLSTVSDADLLRMAGIKGPR